MGSRVEFDLRVDKIYRMMVKGTPIGELKEFIKHEWGVRRSETIQGYINGAKAILEKNLESDRRAFLYMSIAHYQDLYKALYDEGQYADAARIQEKLDRLIGIM